MHDIVHSSEDDAAGRERSYRFLRGLQEIVGELQARVSLGLQVEAIIQQRETEAQAKPGDDDIAFDDDNY